MSSSASEAPIAPMFVHSCPSDFLVIGMQAGEEGGTPIRVLSTLITVSIVSSWCNTRKIKALLLFFSHWLRCGTMDTYFLVLIATYDSPFTWAVWLGHRFVTQKSMGWALPAQS